MFVATSTFVIGPPEVDGRFYVSETHTLGDGSEFTYQYLADNSMNPQFIMEERANIINATLVQRREARLAVQGTSVPFTRFEFLNRFTPEERVAIRAKAATDPYVEDYMEMMKLSGNVNLKLAIPGLQYLGSIGVLSAARAAEIGTE